MKTPHIISLLTCLIAIAGSPCFAMMDIAEVSQVRAKELGMEIRSIPAGPDMVRVELNFETKGELKNFSRVDLEVNEGGKLLVSSTLRDEGTTPGHVVVSFAADRGDLDKITLRVVTQAGREMTGYELRVKDFVEPEKAK